MTTTTAPGSRYFAVAEVLYVLVAIGFFVYLFSYYLTTSGGPTLLAFTLVPVTFILFTLDALRRNEFYPRLGPLANSCIAAVYIAICAVISAYMIVEFEEIGTVRAGVTWCWAGSWFCWSWSSRASATSCSFSSTSS
jgi:hypothetical protein